MNVLARALAFTVGSVLLGGPGVCAPPQWANIGPYGGPIGTFGVDPADGNHLVFFGGMGNTATESLDGGRTWKSGGDSCPTGSSLRDMTPQGDRLYVNCGSVILRSSDHGTTWERFSRRDATAGGGEFIDLFLDPSRQGTAGVIVSRYPEIYAEVTEDGGFTWRTGVPIGSRQIAANPLSSAQLYSVQDANLGGYFAILLTKSSDHGLTWQSPLTVWQAATQTSLSCSSSSVATDAGGILYVVSGCGIHVSRDSGATWILQKYTASTYDFAMDFAADPVRPGHVVIHLGFAGLIETRDGGVSWATLPRFGYAVSRMVIGGDGRLWIGSEAGLYRLDSNAWTAVSTPMRERATGTLAVGGTDGNVVIVTEPNYSYRQNWRSTDGGSTWVPMDGIAKDFTGVMAVPSQPQSFYGQVGSSLFLSTDAGVSWVQTGNGVTGLSPVGPQPGVIYGYTLKIDPFGIGAPSPPDRVVLSRDGGRTWSDANAGLTGGLAGVFPSVTDPSLVFATTGDGIFRSRDSGSSWTRVWNAAQQGFVQQVVPDARQSGLVYARLGREVWSSSDGGDTWRQAAPVNIHGSSMTLRADPVESGRLFLVSDDGSVFGSRDHGGTWSQLSMRDVDAPVGYYPQVAASGSSRHLISAIRSVHSLDVSNDSLVLDTDLWWNPAQSGWGISIAQHASGQMFVVWFTYDAQGNPTWRFVPGGSWLDASTFTGTLYASTGPFFFSPPFDASKVRITPVGTATLRFQDPNSGRATFVQNDGTRFDQGIARMAFGPPRRDPAPSSAGLWWNPDESGWGLAIHDQYGTTFSTWFIYDALGRPTWLFMPDNSGNVYSASGPLAGQPFDASKVAITRTGTASFVLGPYGTVGTFNYGIASTALTRLPF